MNINSYDENLSNVDIISKADNIYIMLYTSLMLKDLKRVDHKISDEVYQIYENEIEKDKSNKVIHVFDELNVKSTNILEVLKTDEKIIVTIKLISRYLNYYLNEETKEFVSGNKDVREEHTNILTLEKKLNAKELKNIRRCPSCGNSLDVSYSGKCDYCGNIFNTEEFDYVLTKIKID